MGHPPLIDAKALWAALQASAAPVVFDCSFELTDPDAGRRIYDAGHIPGATYIHLEHTLSARKTGSNGRHPLPAREAFAQAMAELGVENDTPVVVYDNAGCMYAVRLWWMLRWVGHSTVSVLDGGLAAWTKADLPLSTERPTPRRKGGFRVRSTLVQTVGFDDVLANLQSKQRLVLDARAPDRFRGENETMDPVGGHIPGARNRVFRENLHPDGRFKPPAQLRAEFDALIGGRLASQVVSQCGSGVTACHNLLAMEIAGLSGAALYPGSWSEWCRQPDAPIATEKLASSDAHRSDARER